MNKNILSLFDGISCGYVALERAWIKVENYYASEIDKYAIEISNKNYSNIHRLGDINNWETRDIDWSSIDIVMGWFPCQSWSMSGKKLWDKDPRWQLFWTMLDVIKKVLSSNPNAKFLMENVKMKKEFEDYITFHAEEALWKVNKILINSALVSAQNRNRFYWSNIDWIEQPKDKWLFLRDIILDEVDEEYNLSAEILEKISKRKSFKNPLDKIYDWDMKSATITARWAWEMHSWMILYNTRIPISNFNQDNMFCGLNDKVPTLTTGDWYLRPKTILRRITPEECELLQTLPIWYTSWISKRQRYKVLGNGWTVDVIAHIFKYL